MEEYYGIKASDQSLRNWQKLLINKGWIIKDSAKVKYCLCRKGQAPREISQEEYRNAWNKYFALTTTGVDRGTALHIVYFDCEGMPRKQMGITENAFTLNKTQELRKILGDTY